MLLLILAQGPPLSLATILVDSKLVQSILTRIAGKKEVEILIEKHKGSYKM